MDAEDIAVHPVAYTAESVMIIGLCPDFSALPDAVPVFPDRRSTFFYLIEPGGTFLLEQQLIGALRCNVTLQSAMWR